MAQVLMLNASYMPIGIISWQDAITIWWNKKAEILESYEDKVLHTGNSFIQRKRKEFNSKYDTNLYSWKSAMNMPAVIRLYEFVKPKKNVLFYKPFTRKNVYDRDGGKCQYCNSIISLSKMTFDHVIPKSQGGLTSWNNIVCSCLKCNSKKGGKTPEEANMKLISKPYAPRIAESYHEGILSKLKGMKNVLNNQKWRDYIYWSIPLTED